MRKLLLIIPFCLLINNGYSQEKVMEVGEELKYKVYFGFIPLGEVTFKVNTTYAENGKNHYTAKAQIKSLDDIPFVNVNYIFESVMVLDEVDKEKKIYSDKFTSSEFKEKTITATQYDFNYKEKYIKVQMDKDGMEVQDFRKVPIDSNTYFQDGLSLFYDARIHSFANKNFNVPVFINEQISSVKYSFNINQDVTSTGNIDYDVSVIKVAGVADFVGVFGLTGEFVGWLSNDDLRIPIKANFNVQIGSISLELYSYKRKGWNPPKFEK
ncbi:MAG: DUF3108 domain-containing protein [Ignavibacteriae bacterium]|nr:DUF3108 domain-containing protein [Ignavibacteriota bacterium]